MSRHSIRRTVAAVAFSWMGVLPVATIFASRPGVGPAGYLLSAAVYAVGALVCHQRPERSYHYGSAQWPVCARCLGIYAGAALVMAIVMAAGTNTMGSSATRTRLVLATGLLPTAATLVFEWTTGVTPANDVRALAGAALGAVIGWILMDATGARTPVGVH